MYHIPLNRQRLNAQLFNYHLLAKTKYLEGNMGAQIYTTGKFTVAYPYTKRV